jgi:hypothetical protein
MRTAVAASISHKISHSSDVCISSTRAFDSGTIASVPPKKGTKKAGSTISQLPLADTDTLQHPVANFMALVRRLNAGKSVPSENELSRRLAAVIEALRLTAIIDTSPRGTRKRPDISVYRSKADSNIAVHADAVVESKPPSELHGVDIADAVVDHLWADKTFPYVAKNINRIQYFILTSFVDYACVRITDEMRHGFIAAIARGDNGDDALRAMVREGTEKLSLGAVGRVADTADVTHWLAWLDTHLRNLDHVPLSTIACAQKLVTRDDLEVFASRLAEVAAGPDDTRHRAADAGLFLSLRNRMMEDDELMLRTDPDLRLFVMAQNPSVDAAAAKLLIDGDRPKWVNEFVAASIHSLISRMFALAIIEDIYCVPESQPLIEKSLWVIRADAYDGLSLDALRNAVKARMHRLVESSNALVKRMAVFGSFFDWITEQIDPISFRALFELFVAHDFRDLEGDLLGRFFEVYSQRINRTKRQELGQYYTPLPVVRFMWTLAIDELRSRGLLSRVNVLDPSTGSGAFLSEGAKRLAAEAIPSFWQRLVGFDVSPQVLGIAQVNLYMAVLAQIRREDAAKVQDLNIFTTDTLDHRNGKHLESIVPFLQGEPQRAFLRQSIVVSKEIKQQQHFWLVIGNPPYKNNAKLTLKQVAPQFPRLLGASAADARAQERNVRDDYAWFFAAADHYVQSQGMILFITSDSFLRHESYRLFRRELLRHYGVRRLVRLGTLLFQDVGPDISFVVSVLLRRDEPLSVDAVDDASDDTAVEVHDLRSLSLGAPSSTLGTSEDPRLLLLDRISSGASALPVGTEARPAIDNGYALVPVECSLVERMARDTVAISGKGKVDRVFTKKWPGIITAFDELLKDQDAKTLEQRMFRFLGICRAERGNEMRLRERVEDFARAQGFNEKRTELAVLVGLRAAENGTVFDADKIKQSVSGSIPNEARWYPPPAYRHFVYYEPEIKVDRNENPGKDKGWGPMGGWREPASHLMSPKLIFTSSSNPSYGYKAFVVDDGWYAKLHGGKSQQYNYTGLTVPRVGVTVESNLWAAGLRLSGMFTEHGREQEAVLHYVAGIWNSAFAEAWLNAEAVQPLRIKVPKTKAGETVALDVSDRARDLRDLHRLLFDGPKEGRVERDTLEKLGSAGLLKKLGVTWTAGGSRRFRQVESSDLPAGWVATLEAAIIEQQSGLDAAVEHLYD